MSADFIVNRNIGMDVVHRSAGLSEQCNTDSVVDRKKVDARTAAALVASGEARACKHCIGPSTEAHL